MRTRLRLEALLNLDLSSDVEALSPGNSTLLRNRGSRIGRTAQNDQKRGATKPKAHKLAHTPSMQWLSTLPLSRIASCTGSPMLQVESSVVTSKPQNRNTKIFVQDGSCTKRSASSSCAFRGGATQLVLWLLLNSAILLRSLPCNSLTPPGLLLGRLA